MVSVSSCGSTYCWVIFAVVTFGTVITFQYPRADRLIVGDRCDLPGKRDRRVSVSSCGSTYCWGRAGVGHRAGADRFQYPRADRLIVGAHCRPGTRRPTGSFSILVRIDLLLGGVVCAPGWGAAQCFSILVRIDLLLGASVYESRGIRML